MSNPLDAGQHDHVLLRCTGCGNNSWAPEYAVPKADWQGTMIRCPHCDKPLSAEDRAPQKVAS